VGAAGAAGAGGGLRRGLAFLRAREADVQKTPHAAQQERPDVAEARAAWREAQPGFDVSRLVFIDETWAKDNMVRLYGRSPRGQRLLDKVPLARWQTTTFVAALRSDGLTAPTGRSTASGSWLTSSTGSVRP